jgi:hypothetical protein
LLRLKLRFPGQATQNRDAGIKGRDFVRAAENKLNIPKREADKNTRRVRRHPRGDHGIGRFANFRASRP